MAEAHNCCLYCGLQELGVGKSLLNYAQNQSISVADVLEMNHFYVKSLLNQMDEGTRSSILDLCRYLIGVFGPVYAPLFHSGHLFKDNYIISANVNGVERVFGETTCGDVLELIKDDVSSGVVEQVIEKMKMECLNIEVSNNISPEHSRFVLNKVVRISTGRNQMEVFHGTEVTEVFALSHNQGTMLELFQKLQGHLELIESVNLLVVDCTPTSPTVKEWIDFFSSIYCGLSIKVCVFVIPYNVHQDVGVNSMQQLKEFVNFDMDLDAEIKWLDLTMINVFADQRAIESIDMFLF